MFFLSLIKFFKGYVKIKVSGKFPERFFNVCANKKILLWDVYYDDNGNAVCSMSMNAFKMLSPIAKKTGVSTSIISKHGFPHLIRKYRKRKMFLFGILFFFIALFALNQFVWDIEIIGCENVSSKAIEKNLSDLGVKKGALRFLIDETEIKNKMLLKMPSLSWLWLDKSGSKIVVNVRESVPVPKIYDYSDYCNIVAAKDGIISSMTVINGTPLVEIGDTVQKGDILVSGLMISERGIEPRYIQADGTVYASVWYEETDKFPLAEEKHIETGNISKINKISIFGWTFKPFWQKIPMFMQYKLENNVRSFSLFGMKNIITINTDIYREYKSEKIPLDEKSVVNDAVLKLSEKIDKSAGADSTVDEIRHSFKINSDKTAEVTVIAEYTENIGVKTKIDR